MKRWQKWTIGILIAICWAALPIAYFINKSGEKPPQKSVTVKNESVENNKTFSELKKRITALEKTVKKLQQSGRQEAGKRIAASAPALVSARRAMVPNAGAAQFVLRILVVEWSEDFRGKSLLSRDIGPVVKEGLANGTVVRTKSQCGFIVNGASIVVNDGQAIVDPGPIGPETALTVQPSAGPRFASPPDALPLTTNPGELYALVQRESSEIWLCFILAPPA